MTNTMGYYCGICGIKNPETHCEICGQDLEDNEKVFKSVHDAHCCTRHGCKYGYSFLNKECPVEAGKEPGILCETCQAEDQDPQFCTLRLLREHRRLLKEGKPTPPAETVLKNLLKELGDA